jgi:hypothetical protein
MDRATSGPQRTAQGNPSTQRRSGEEPQPGAPPQSGAPLIAGKALVQTIRHFFPDFNHWLDRLPDSRLQEACTYSRRSLAWWGISLYLLQLGARRQLDFQLRDAGPPVLSNLNRLAETDLETLPVHDTLDHFLDHSKRSGWEKLRNQMVQRLLRMKTLDAARCLGRPVLLLDATGLIAFRERHCNQCLVQRHKTHTLYLHQVLEAKLLGPAGVVISLDSEFIENADAQGVAGRSAEQIKQDCELKAAARLLPRIKKAYPQLPFVVSADNLYACGAFFELVQRLGWSYVVTFKEGRMPAFWKEYRALLQQCPDNVVQRQWADGKLQEFRWVPQLHYQDSADRTWKVNALECTETMDGDKQYFAWLTTLSVNRKTVEEIAQKGGRARWKIENEGFNRQKNSGMNLEHVYSSDPEKSKIYYLLLQIAFVLTQLLERGSLLRRLTADVGRSVLTMFGSLRNLAQRLLDSLRFLFWDECWFQPTKLRIYFDDS